MVKEDKWLTLEEATQRLEEAGYTVENKGDYITYNSPNRGSLKGMLYNNQNKGFDEQWIRQAEISVEGR